MDPKTKNNDKPTTTNGEEKAEAAPLVPSPVELTQTQAQIVGLIGHWAPESQRRVLNTTGLALGVQLGPQSQARPPQQSRQQPPAGGNRR